MCFSGLTSHAANSERTGWPSTLFLASPGRRRAPPRKDERAPQSLGLFMRTNAAASAARPKQTLMSTVLTELRKSAASHRRRSPAC